MARSRSVVQGLLALSALTALGVAGCQDSHPSAAASGAEKLTYPNIAPGDTVDDYHGVKVADPYRSLEEYTEGTNAWIEAENKVTFSYLEKIPQRGVIKTRLTQLWNYERYTPPFKEGGRYFYSRNDGLQNQSVFFTTKSIADSGKMLLDPNTLSKDGTVALAGTVPSKDGKYLAYATADGGSDWNIWRVIEIDTGKQVGEDLKWIKFGGATWTRDNAGFFYSKYDEPKKDALKAVNENQRIFHHTLGEAQSKDTLVYERPDHPKWYLFSGVTDAGDYLIVYPEDPDTINSAVFYKSLAKPDAPIVELLNKWDAKYGFVDNDGTTFYLTTDKDAPHNKLVAIDITKAKDGVLTEPRVIIPEAKETLESVSYVGGKFFATYLQDAHSVIRIYSPEGKNVGEVQLPGIGTAGGFGGKKNETETFYTFTNYNTPPTIYRYDTTTGKSEVYRQPKVAFNPSDYESKEIFYASKDGTKVPMFITHKKGLKLDGSNPTLLYAYGGFNISITPSFSPATLQWMEMGGVYAVACLRGGGEYGTDWHKAGTRTHKQNVFDDFIAAGEWLVANKYTQPKRLAIQGGSNGGLLVGACLTQRPDLYGACLPAVGVMDMLRFQKFTVGAGWKADYGDSEKNADEFKAIRAYSPYHNIKKGTCYPPTLITTADHDDRVYPAHSFKFAAALQAAQSCANPTLIRIEVRAGHGAGKPTSKRIEEVADLWSFLVKNLDFNPTIPSGGSVN
jgi:prolyl oligopeptidase